MRESNNCSDVDITSPQDIGAESDIGWLAADRCNVILQCDFTTFSNFIPRHIWSQ
jgi:hypothetical protein